MIAMAAEKKKPDDENVTRERAHVSDKTCSRSAFSLSRRPEAIGAAAPRPDSPPIRVQTSGGYRHERKGAVRERRSASLNSRPRPSPRERVADNAYVDTSFVTADDGKPAVADTAAGGTAAAAAEQVSSTSADDTAAAAAAAEPVASTSAGGTAFRRPFIDFASISEEELMRPIGPPSTQLDDGVEEFPAYVPWKAAYTWPENATNEAQRSENGNGGTVTCFVCKRCRCSVCQTNCKYLKTTFFGVDVSQHQQQQHQQWQQQQQQQEQQQQQQSNVTFVDVLDFLPCVKKTARCVANDNGTAASKWFRNPFAAKRRYQRPAEDDKWPYLRSLLAACLPCVGSYRPLSSADRCSDNCIGNIRVAGCVCVDWGSMRNGRRVRGQDSAYYAALSSSTADRRRRYQNQRLTDNTDRAVKAAKTIAAAKKIAAAKAETAAPVTGGSTAVGTDAAADVAKTVTAATAATIAAVTATATAPAAAATAAAVDKKKKKKKVAAKPIAENEK